MPVMTEKEHQSIGTAIQRDGSIRMKAGYRPAFGDDVATAKYVDDVVEAKDTMPHGYVPTTPDNIATIGNALMISSQHYTGSAAPSNSLGRNFDFYHQFLKDGTAVSTLVAEFIATDNAVFDHWSYIGYKIPDFHIGDTNVGETNIQVIPYSGLLSIASEVDAPPLEDLTIVLYGVEIPLHIVVSQGGNVLLEFDKDNTNFVSAMTNIRAGDAIEFKAVKLIDTSVDKLYIKSTGVWREMVLK